MSFERGTIMALSYLAARVVRVLHDRALESISFGFGSLVVIGRGFASVAEAVRREEIGCVRDRSLPDSRAEYDMDDNEMRFSPETNLTEVNGRALIVHEATHALHDYYPMRTVSRLDAEGAAYVAHNMYRVLKGEDRILLSSDWATTQIHRRAFRIAKEIRAGRFFASQYETIRLRSNIRAHPVYGSESETLYFDGV